MKRLTMEDIALVSGGKKWAQCLLSVGKYKGRDIACGKICYGATQAQANRGLSEHQSNTEHDPNKILG